MLKPLMTVDAKRGKVGGRFDLGVDVISLGVKAGLTFPSFKMCRACGPWGCCCFSYPCGWGWGSNNEFEIDRISLGTGGVHNLLSEIGDASDRSPPKVGTVNISQIGARHVAVKFASFTEEESDILSTQFEVRLRYDDGPIFYCHAFEGAAESWSGELTAPPLHEDWIIICVEVRNSYDLKAKKCSEAIVWDAAPPEVTAFYTVNPFTNFWQMANPLCEDKVAAGTLDERACWLYTNVTDRIRFAMRLTEVPSFGDARSPIKSAVWAISIGARCQTLACPEGALVAPFAPIGHAQRLVKGTLGTYFNTDVRQWRPYPLLEVYG